METFSRIKNLIKTTNPVYDVKINSIDNTYKKNLLAEFGKYSLEELPNYINNTNNVIIITCDNITLNIITPELKIPLLLLKEVLKRVRILCIYLEINKDLNIYFIPCESKRYFPKCEKCQITPQNINGGFTYTLGNDIYIYRMEDFPKVMLHETIHLSRLDTSSLWTKEKTDLLKDFFKIHSNQTFLINEAIVEFYAQIFHLIFVATKFKVSFSDLYKIELQWAQIQSLRILYKQTQFKDMEWREGSNAFCYIVIRSALLMKYKEFMNIEYNIENIYKFIREKCSYKFKIKKQFISSSNETLKATVYGIF